MISGDRKILCRIALWGGVLAMAALFSGCDRTPNGARRAPDSPAKISRTKGAADFDPLKGRWVRQDGDYMIEIKSVAPDGKMDAGYFNPRPIHVGKAEVEIRDDALRVYVLLADQGYPGSNYRLRYDSDSDTLQGSYHQAASGETFSVIFDRLRE